MFSVIFLVLYISGLLVGMSVLLYCLLRCWRRDKPPTSTRTRTRRRRTVRKRRTGNLYTAPIEPTAPIESTAPTEPTLDSVEITFRAGSSSTRNLRSSMRSTQQRNSARLENEMPSRQRRVNRNSRRRSSASDLALEVLKDLPPMQSQPLDYEIFWTRYKEAMMKQQKKEQQRGEVVHDTQRLNRIDFA